MEEAKPVRVTLVTGAAGSIGHAVVARFVAGGDRVLALDRDAEGPHGLVARFGAAVTPVWAELADWSTLHPALSAAIAGTGAVGALIACAGTAESASLAVTTPDSWKRDLDANLTAGYHSVEAVLPSLRERGGAIVFISTLHGLTALGHPAHSAAKAGLLSLARSLAMEYGRSGVRANVVCSGAIKPSVLEARRAADPGLDAALLHAYPSGALPQPEDVAEAAWFLASPAARMINGAMLPVDGGLLAGDRALAAAMTGHPF